MILYFNNYLNNAQNLDSKILQSGPRLTFDKSFETTHIIILLVYPINIVVKTLTVINDDDYFDDELLLLDTWLIQGVSNNFLTGVYSHFQNSN